MNYDRAYVQSFIDRFVRPKQPELARPLLLAFDALSTRSKRAEECLQYVVDAASHRSASINSIGTEFLAELSETSGPAMDGIKRMSQSNLAHVRHNAILCVSANTPNDEALKVIGRALKDVSSKVRVKAVDWSLRLNLQEALPLISQALEKEKTASVAEAMAHSLEQLR